MAYPDIEPFERGTLDAGEGHRLAWWCVGNPDGKPAVVLHGGPGSGCTAWHGTLFDPSRYRVVLFDQRGCGRSTPDAADLGTDLRTITTARLVEDIDRLRIALGIERWLVWGGSWGSTLALAYAVAHPDRVTELVLWGITTGRHREADLVWRGGLATRYPDAWTRLRALVAPHVRDRDVPAAYAALLRDEDPAVRRVASVEWCRWESAIESWPPTDELSERYRDPAFALTFATIVTHFASNDLFLRDGELLERATALRDVPTILVAGRDDVQAPLENAQTLRAAMPHAELVVVEGAGHLADDPPIERALVAATDRFAAEP